MARRNSPNEVHGVNKQIPHHALIYIMIAQAAVILPHIQQSSNWLPIVALICAAWRWLIYLGKYQFPKWPIKLALSIVSGALILTTVATLHSLETWSSFLVLTFSLKLLETKTRRDTYVVIFLAYFLISVNFIYSQSIILTLYQIIACILATAALVSLHQSYSQDDVYKPIKVAGKIIAQAVPLMVILFIIFPRLAPFWSLPSTTSARTGLSEEMTPGDIASLTKSDEIAFRAVFFNKQPNNDELYWRGLVLSNFSNGTWSLGNFPPFKHTQPINWQAREKEKSLLTDPTNQTNHFSYRILQEPSNKLWKFGLDLAIPQDNGNGLTWDFRVVGKETVSALTSYKINSYPKEKLNQELPRWLRQRETKTPINDNPQAVLFAKDLYSKSTTDYAFIEKLLAYIRSDNFSYTLEPPTLDKQNSIDQFWFDSQAGFCMHYAGAMTYMLRAVGIPARVVAGYQGGDINPVTGHTVVRQYHAHAWVEAWLPHKGWQRFDPTAAIAPERVNQGLEAALSEDDRNSLSAFTNARLNKALFSARMLNLFESIEHRWNLTVVGFDSKNQSELLANLLGKITPLRIALLLFAGMLLSFAFAGIATLLNRTQKVTHPAVVLLNNFTTHTKKYGFERSKDESPMHYIKRICLEKKITQKIYTPLIDCLEKLLYASKQSPKQSEIKALKSHFTQVKQALKT